MLGVDHVLATHPALLEGGVVLEQSQLEGVIPVVKRLRVPHGPPGGLLLPVLDLGEALFLLFVLFRKNSNEDDFAELLENAAELVLLGEGWQPRDE